MSAHIGRRRSKKTEERYRLATTIGLLGFETMPCSNCRLRGVACKMVDAVSRCEECVRRGRSCDGCLRAQEKESERELYELHQKSSEILARLERLRTQRESLVSRGVKMVNLGLQSLGALEEQERLGVLGPVRSGEVGVMSSLENAVDAVDWGSMDISELDLTPLVGLGSLGGTGEQAAGNSGGS
jgi:hypothetical protein